VLSLLRARERAYVRRQSVNNHHTHRSSAARASARRRIARAASASSFSIAGVGFRARGASSPAHAARDAARRARATTTRRKYFHEISLARAPHLCY